MVCEHSWRSTPSNTFQTSQRSGKKYGKECFEWTLAKIEKEIGENHIWVSVDETTDASGRYVANFVIGTMKAEEAGTPILLNTDVLEKVNHSTIARFLTLSGAFVARKY
ncbi:unnamed protein product [Ixodes hexagonus]